MSINENTSQKGKRKRIFEIALFFVLMLLIVAVYGVTTKYMKTKKESLVIQKERERVYTSSNEFVRTIDCSPIFDENPEGTAYKIKFELMSQKDGDILVYQQNGSNYRYTFSEVVRSTNKWTQYEIEVIPDLIDENVKASFLSFYGEYGTGVIPSVRYIEIQKIDERKNATGIVR